MLELPLPPNLANSRMHWRVRTRKGKAYRLAARVAILNARLADKQWPHISVRPRFYVWNMMDIDNAFGRLKWAMDALTRSGVIPDDRPAFVRYETDPDTGGPYQVITRTPGGQKLVLEITPDG